jgi:hypothetical protein
MQKERAQLSFIEPMECKAVDSLPETSDHWQQESSI